MNGYTRLYWLCLLATGIALALQWVPRAFPDVRADTVAPLLGGVAVVFAAGYALATDRTDGAPEAPNALFAVVVIAFLLTVAGAVVQFT